MVRTRGLEIIYTSVIVYHTPTQQPALQKRRLNTKQANVVQAMTFTRNLTVIAGRPQSTSAWKQVLSDKQVRLSLRALTCQQSFRHYLHRLAGRWFRSDMCAKPGRVDTFLPHSSFPRVK